jgi:hypothetical protein
MWTWWHSHISGGMLSKRLRLHDPELRALHARRSVPRELRTRDHNYIHNQHSYGVADIWVYVLPRHGCSLLSIVRSTPPSNFEVLEALT